MPELLSEVNQFKEWAATFLPGCRGGEWECEYSNWPSLHQAVLEFVSDRPVAAWSEDELQAVLYAVARDNEIEYLAREIRTRSPETLIGLALSAVTHGEPDAKWQIAEQLGRLKSEEASLEMRLLNFAHDADEYVRRRSLQALARRGSPAVEELALLSWNQPDAMQQYARMAALWSLHRIGSPLLGPLLDEAECDERPYLSGFAQKVRRGEVDS